MIFQPVKRFFNQLANKNGQLIKLQEQLSYFFSDTNLLIQAITHKSMASDYATNYERLEFLGDAVIDHVISEKLFHEFPEASEGILTKKRIGACPEIISCRYGKLAESVDIYFSGIIR